MKILRPMGRCHPWAAAVMVLGFQWAVMPGGLAADSPAKPVITSLRLAGTNVVISARVPPGLRKITLEGRPQMRRGAWEPHKVIRLDGTGGEVSFSVPQVSGMHVLRVRANDQEPLPAVFYRGTNVFAGAGGETTSTTGGAEGGPILTMDGGANVPGATPTTGRGSEAGDTRAVVESDIWQLQGDTLYFFNQYRGLQIVDISHPDAATITGTLELPAAGEQMYLLEGGYIVLLTRDYCASSSEVFVVAVGGGPPRITASFALPGTIQESRLVGNVLYVASQTSRSSLTPDGSVQWEYGTLVSTFDLGAPDIPLARDSLWVGGPEHAVTATDQFLFVAVQDPVNYWRSVLNAVDITDPTGVLGGITAIQPAGRVPDKFKINLEGTVLSVVSEEDRWTNSQRVLVTRLETFFLPDPRTLPPGVGNKLGEVELIRNERVFASRFDGNRAYVVTFQRVDPLWVVDLADPARPRVVGELQIPGWSTYIHPLGNQLVTVGIDNTNGAQRVAVQLFDVSDPAKPGLLAKVPLGDSYSWSEANADEKAFKVLPEAGLILIPYNGYTTNGYAQRVQLIDLGTNSLAARGVIDHQFQPRRATLHRERILTLSGWELLSVDATDRDQPRVRGQLELAWEVNRVFVVGNYVVELAGNPYRYYPWQSAGSSVVLRVAPEAEPHRVLQTLVLTNNLPLAGVTERGGRLFIAQASSDSWGPIVVLNGSGAEGDTNAPPAANFILTIVDLGGLPDLTVVGQTAQTLDPLGWNPNLSAVWPRPDLLVWSTLNSSFWWWYGIDVLPVGGVRMANSLFWWPYYGGNQARLIAFDVGDAAQPQFRSDITLSTNYVSNVSSPYATGGLVFISHDDYEYHELPPIIVPMDPTIDPLDPTQEPTAPQYRYCWTRRSFLDVVDYSDPVHPTVRKPVNIPGRLEGLSHNGALLYTVGQHFATNGTSDYTQWLDISAYDDVSASLVDSLALPTAWPSPHLVLGTNIFLGQPGNGTNPPPQLERYALAEDTGKITRLGAVTLTAPAQELAGFGDLLIARTTQIDLFNAPALQAVGSDRVVGCLWLDLANADGAADRGAWIPMGSYGIKRIAVAPITPITPPGNSAR